MFASNQKLYEHTRYSEITGEKLTWFIAHDAEHSTLTVTLIAQTAAPHYLELEQKTDHTRAMNIDITMTTVTITAHAAAVSGYLSPAYSS